MWQSYGNVFQTILGFYNGQHRRQEEFKEFLLLSVVNNSPKKSCDHFDLPNVGVKKLVAWIISLYDIERN